MSIRKKVANLWAPLLQSKGNSTTQPMSQKAVSDELNQLKSDLDGKINYTDSLSIEEIMATNIDLTNKVASASAVQTLGNNVKNRLYDGVTLTTFDSIYLQMKTGMRAVYVRGEGDYYLIQIYRTDTEGCQIRIKLSDGKIEKRILRGGTWNNWSSLT